MKILVVEDSPQVAETVMDYLELTGHRVDCAYHGQAALQLLAEQRFDVIIMDVMMPRLDGLRTVERLRSDGIATLCSFSPPATAWTTSWQVSRRGRRLPGQAVRHGGAGGAVAGPGPARPPQRHGCVGVRRAGGGSAASRATRAGVELKLGKIPFQILSLLVKRAPIW